MFLSYHAEIVKSYYNWQTWYACKWSRSKVAVTEVKANFPQFRRFRIIIQFEFTDGYKIIHIAWNRKEKKSCLIVFQGYLSNFKVTEDKYFAVFYPNWALRTATLVWINQWLQMTHKAWTSKAEVPCCFARSSVKFKVHTGHKIIDFDTNWPFPDSNSAWIYLWLQIDAQSLK